MSIKAGEFVDWLNEFIKTMTGKGAGNVPCGECVACCTSKKFILVRPSDTQARSRIPKELLFAAPNLPKGYHLMGYDKQGHCPMFKEGRCSIYPHRPATCRQYDCRVLAAAGAEAKEESSEIAERVMAWEFSYSQPESERKSRQIKRAMWFLRQYSALFPPGYVPQSESQKSALAVSIHGEFSEPAFASEGALAPQETPEEKVMNIIKKFPHS